MRVPCKTGNVIPAAAITSVYQFCLSQKTMRSLWEREHEQVHRTAEDELRGSGQTQILAKPANQHWPQKCCQLYNDGNNHLAARSRPRFGADGHGVTLGHR